MAKDERSERIAIARQGLVDQAFVRQNGQIGDPAPDGTRPHHRLLHGFHSAR
jgi:hypothetical protein